MTQYIYKTIIIGDSGVGKSIFLYKLRHLITNIDILTTETIGVDFFSKIYSKKLKNRKILETKLDIWDISGKENFRVITNFYIKSMCGIILIFNLHAPNWYESISNWINLIALNKTCIHSKPHPIMLIGNKYINKKSLFKYEKISSLIKIYNITYIELDILNVPVENIDYVCERLVTNIRAMNDETCKGITIPDSYSVNNELDDNKYLQRHNSNHDMGCNIL
jgi:small GTP-binding protein